MSEASGEDKRWRIQSFLWRWWDFRLLKPFSSGKKNPWKPQNWLFICFYDRLWFSYKIVAQDKESEQVATGIQMPFAQRQIKEPRGEDDGNDDTFEEMEVDTDHFCVSSYAVWIASKRTWS